MNRSDLVKALQQRTDLSPKDAEWLVRSFFRIVADGLKEDGRVELRGLGVFRTAVRHQAGFLNPKNNRYYGKLTLKTVKFYPSTTVGNEDF